MIEGSFSIAKFPASDPIPKWISSNAIFSVTKTGTELSVVCETRALADKPLNVENDWRLFRIKGHLDFALTGILASIADPLARAKISIFAISTFDTDYVMVKADKLEDAKTVLRKSGFKWT